MISGNQSTLRSGVAHGRWLGVASFIVALAVVLAYVVPEALRDRIYPFDSVLHAANGGLFLSLLKEFGTFIQAPMDWFWAYYNQYPALGLRRHPPLFGVVEALVYAFTGVSVLGAKLTLLLFSLLFVVGTYLLALRLWKDHLVAGAATLLIATSQLMIDHFRTIWVDVPALAFASFAFLFYMRRLDHEGSPWSNALLMALFTLLALYTYQPVVFLLLGMFVFMLFAERLTILKDRPLLTAGAILVVGMLPLAIHTAYVAPDTFKAAAGTLPSAWKEFSQPGYAPELVSDKTSLAYWLDYGSMFVWLFPLQAAGSVLWLLLWIWRKPNRAGLFVFTCAIVTLATFSWYPLKVPRYALYLALPTSLLTVSALLDIFRWLQGRIKLRHDYIAYVATLLVILLAWLATPELGIYRKLEGMDQPVKAILATKPDARIFYAGRYDTAFIYYLRMYDDKRLARVARASVQIEAPQNLQRYIEQERFDFVVFEGGNPPDRLKIIDEFRAGLERFVGKRSGYSALGEYRLPYVGPGKRDEIIIRVYRQSS